MLLKKDVSNSSNAVAIYDVSDGKWLSIVLNHDNSIETIRMVDCSRGWDDSDMFAASGLVFLENICSGENNEYLDTDLLAAAEHCFQEVC